jgi:hypothetical protein
VAEGGQDEGAGDGGQGLDEDGQDEVCLGGGGWDPSWCSGLLCRMEESLSWGRRSGSGLHE